MEVLRAEMRRVLQALPAITAAIGPNSAPKLTPFATSKRLNVQLPNNQLVDIYRESEVGIYPHLRNQIETVEKILQTPEHSPARRVASFSGGTPSGDPGVGAEERRFTSMSTSVYPRRVPLVPVRGAEGSPILELLQTSEKDGRSTAEVIVSRRRLAEGEVDSSPGGSEQAGEEGEETEASTKLRGGWAQLAVFLTNRRQQVIVLLLWLAANCALFLWKYMKYMDQPEYKITG